ncbi:MAG: hypothetical protein Kow0022_15700 [Phycisphaerales bacterium]
MRSVRGCDACYAVPVSKEPTSAGAEQRGHSSESAAAVARRLGPAAVLAGLWALTPLIGLGLMTYFGSEIAGWFRSLDEQGVGLAAYVACFAVGAGLGLLPTWIQAVMGGFVFGLGRGFAAAEAGFVLAALLAFAVSRTVARERVEREIRSHPKARVVRDALVGRSYAGTLGVVTLVRLNSPFALTNLVLAATGVPLLVYVAGTAVGLGVRTFIAVHIGSQLTSLSDAHKPKWLVYTSIAVAVILIVVIGHIAQRAMNRLADGRGAGEDGEQEGPEADAARRGP